MKRLIVALFALGLILGAAYARWIDPIHITEASPAQVSETYRHAWIMMAAEALAQDGAWDRTRARLDALHDPALPQTVKALFDQIDAQGSRATARALAQLADRLGARTAEMSVYLITPAITPTPAPNSTRPTPTGVSERSTPTPTVPGAAAPPTATPSITPPPLTPSPVPTYNPGYQIISQIAECTRATATPQIRVTVQDAAGQGLAGVTIWITWGGGADRFVTGLKPEINAGYGDFDMLRDRNYNVSIDQPESVIAAGLRAEDCAAGGAVSWRLTIRPAAR
ncbi:hypothetical protein PLCT1_01537 [Planctomycetaceae bacterium]|nr:hypothetical protein PLCT1_01537 [Planctomycetaceae bacterium]